MQLSDFLLALCCDFHHRSITAGAAGLPRSWLAGFAYAFGSRPECRGSAWPGLSCPQLRTSQSRDAPDGKQKPGTPRPGGDAGGGQLAGADVTVTHVFLPVSISAF